MAIVVGETKGFGVTEARAAGADAPPSDAALNVVESIAFHVDGSAGGGARLAHSSTNPPAVLTARHDVVMPTLQNAARILRRP